MTPFGMGTDNLQLYKKIASTPVSEDVEQVEEGERHGVLLEPSLHVVQLCVEALLLDS